MKIYKVSMFTLSALMAGSLLLPAQGNAQTGQAVIENPVFLQSAEQQLGEGTLDHRATVKRLIDEAANNKDVPGVIAVVTKNGTKWSYASGEASIYDTRPMKTDFSFRIGSTTKTFVATVVLQLAEEQKLSLDDPVEKWLPGVVQGNGYDGSQIKIRQLLNHTSGIANYTSLETFREDIINNPFRAIPLRSLFV